MLSNELEALMKTVEKLATIVQSNQEKIELLNNGMKVLYERVKELEEWRYGTPDDGS